jgi:hypothetical protein
MTIVCVVLDLLCVCACAIVAVWNFKLQRWGIAWVNTVTALIWLLSAGMQLHTYFLNAETTRLNREMQSWKH